MNRRDFLATAAAAPLVGGAALAQPPDSLGTTLPRFKITRIVGFKHVGRRPKMVGKNARLDLHGNTNTDHVLRIFTDQGVEGFGVGNVEPAIARRLIGHSLDEFWRPKIGVLSPLGRSDHALYDLIGKALEVPAWTLFGKSKSAWIPVYDGGVYFNDLLPEFEKRGVSRLVEEVETSLAAGHRAFKIKIGRGHKWMEKEAGFRRDVEVVRAIRKAAGKDVKLMVDANNGFDLETAKKWLDAVGGDVFWAEEMFPENVPDDQALKAHIKTKGFKTLVADGESARDLDDLVNFIDAEALDVFQPDVRAFGLTRQAAAARRLAVKPGLSLAPHNWGSFLGLYMQLTLARGISNFLMAEQDVSTSDLFDASAFTFRDGEVRVPDDPGCGLKLDDNVFNAKYQPTAWMVES